MSRSITYDQALEIEDKAQAAQFPDLDTDRGIDAYYAVIDDEVGKRGLTRNDLWLAFGDRDAGDALQDQIEAEAADDQQRYLDELELGL